MKSTKLRKNARRVWSINFSMDAKSQTSQLVELLEAQDVLMFTGLVAWNIQNAQSRNRQIHKVGIGFTFTGCKYRNDGIVL